MLQNLGARLVGTRHMSEMQTSDWLHNVDYSHGPNIHDSTIAFEHIRTIKKLNSKISLGHWIRKL